MKPWNLNDMDPGSAWEIYQNYIILFKKEIDIKQKKSHCIALYLWKKQEFLVRSGPESDPLFHEGDPLRISKSNFFI